MNTARTIEQNDIRLTRYVNRRNHPALPYGSAIAMLALIGASSFAPLHSAQAAESTSSTAQPTTQTTPQAAPAAPRMTKRVVVKAFDPPEASIANWNVVGGEIADMMITGLVNNGVDVMERRTMSDMEMESERAMDGTLEEGTGAESGHKLGGQVMLVGRVTEFGVSEKGKTFGGGMLPIIGVFGKKKTMARVKIDGRLVDIRSGRVIAALSSEATETNGRTTIAGLFGAAGVFDSRSSEWTQSMLGKAMRKAVDDFSAKIALRVPTADAASMAGDSSSPSLATSASPSSNFDQMPGIAQLRKMTCVVLIPETHLMHPHVPDPAAETEIMRQLLAAGIKVKDDQRLRELRDEKWVLEAAHGDLSQAQLFELKTRYGADILIIGEGISERTERNTTGSNAVVCRGRVEVKAIRMDTGSIIAAEATQQAGRDLSEILSSKAALKNAGATVAPQLISSMAQNLAHGAASNNTNTVSMELEVKGFASLKAANAFLNALDKVSGIESAEMQDWKGGLLFATLEVSQKTAKRVGLLLETDATLAQFNVQVSDSNGAKVQGVVKKP